MPSIIPIEDCVMNVLDNQPKGGQRVGIVSSRINLTHIPTGIQIVCGHRRSQQKNIQCAMSMLEEALTNPDLQ